MICGLTSCVQMAPQVLNRVCYGDVAAENWQIRARTISPAILPDYSRRKVQWADYPAIIESKGDAVRGTFVTGLTDADLWRLDIFEGSQYERVKLKVRLLLDADDGSGGEGHVGGDEVEAETYVWIAAEDGLEQDEWDFAEFRRDKLRYWAGRSEEYTGESPTELADALCWAVREILTPDLEVDDAVSEETNRAGREARRTRKGKSPKKSKREPPAEVMESAV